MLTDQVLACFSILLVLSDWNTSVCITKFILEVRIGCDEYDEHTVSPPTLLNAPDRHVKVYSGKSFEYFKIFNVSMLHRQPTLHCTQNIMKLRSGHRLITYSPTSDIRTSLYVTIYQYTDQDVEHSATQ